MYRPQNVTETNRLHIWAAENSFRFNTTHLLPRSSITIKRKNQSNMTNDEKEYFLNSIQTLISSGDYGKHVSYYGNHNHRMHSSHGEIGKTRFLPWHRIYLFELEQMLQAFEQDTFIPYWDWTTDRDIPEWLVNFTPTVIVDNQPRVVRRSPHRSPNTPNLPPEGDVNMVMSLNSYGSFTSGLEGGIFGAGGLLQTQTQMHNEVHGWVGGIMGNIRYSPTDVLFWLHHANCDRIWAQWQKEHPSKIPGLSGTDSILDPWTYTEEETLDTSSLGYIYD